MRKWRHILLLALISAPLLNSCLYLTPEGRKVRQLRQMQKQVAAEHAEAQARMENAQRSYDTAKEKYDSYMKSMRQRPTMSVTPVEREELERLQLLLQQKQKELQDAEDRLQHTIL